MKQRSIRLLRFLFTNRNSLRERAFCHLSNTPSEPPTGKYSYAGGRMKYERAEICLLTNASRKTELLLGGESISTTISDDLVRDMMIRIKGCWSLWDDLPEQNAALRVRPQSQAGTQPQRLF